MELQTKEVLTEKEKLALSLLGKGYVAHEIGALLGVGDDAMYVQFRTIRRKLHARTNEQAVLMAYDQDLI